jgi:hypothetical protein
MIYSAIKTLGWTVPLLKFSVGPAVGVKLWWSNWFLVGVRPKNIYCVGGFFRFELCDGLLEFLNSIELNAS